MNCQQYYPTPIELGNRLAKLIEHPQPPILEPSAGTGDLIQAFQSVHKFHYPDKDFHCVELNPDRAATLKGKEFMVMWDDFLTFNPLMPYRTIIMNPPFHDGAKHLQKALHILADGGEIACILNAETVRNPYTNERKALIRELEAAEVYQVEFVQSAFANTDVEVALLYVKKSESAVHCATFENFKKSVIAEREQADPQSLIRHGEVNALIDSYRAEVKAALHLYDEVINYNRICIHEPYQEIFSIKLNSHDNGYAGIVKAVNYNYWCRLLHSEELDRLLTCDAARDYSSKLRQMQEYEFNERNILQLKADLTANLFGSIDAAIMKVWNNFTHRFSTDNTANIHYYNGWRTNKAFKCNKMVEQLMAATAQRQHSSDIGIVGSPDQIIERDVEKIGEPYNRFKFRLKRTIFEPLQRYGRNSDFVSYGFLRNTVLEPQRFQSRRNHHQRHPQKKFPWS